MDLTNQFLIAMPSLQDPNFHRTVTYLCAHNDDGAMGIVINRPLDLNLGEVLEHMSIEVEDQNVNDMMVLHGGPVQRDRGFVIHEPAGEWDAVLAVGNSIGVATGYAGWGAGQLEREVQQNAWLSGPADSSIIFDLPYDERYESAARLLGVELDRLSGEAGHA
jgi:putative transcriptional regulator